MNNSKQKDKTMPIQIQQLNEVEIPDKFFNRVKTGIDDLDILFGGEANPGMLPGMSMMIVADPGCGKSSLTQCICNALHNHPEEPKRALYTTGEQSFEMVALNARKRFSYDFPMAVSTDVDELIEAMDELDLIVIDSFSMLTRFGNEIKLGMYKAIAQEFIDKAQEKDCILIFIMHITTTGKPKGGTTVPHLVDACFRVANFDINADPERKVISTEAKNRFGPPTEVQALMKSTGFEFGGTTIERPTTNATGKSVQKQQEYDAILNAAKENDGKITIEQATAAMAGNITKAYTRLRELVATGQLEDWGKNQPWALPVSIDDLEQMIKDEEGKTSEPEIITE